MLSRGFTCGLLILMRGDTHNPFEIAIKGRKVLISANAVNGSDSDVNYKGRRTAYEGIAPVLYREDPYRRFLPSSPYGGKRYASNTVGTTHNTQFLGQMFPFLLGEDLSDYKDEFKKYRARFIAEEPQMGAVSLPSLRRFMSEDDIFKK